MNGGGFYMFGPPSEDGSSVRSAPRYAWNDDQFGSDRPASTSSAARPGTSAPSRAGTGARHGALRAQAERVQTGGVRAGKVELKKKAEWLEEFKKIRTKMAALEKERNTNLFNNRNVELKELMAPCVEVYKETTEEVVHERERMKQNLSKISGTNERLRRLVEQRGTGQAYLDSLRKLMDDVEGGIYDFKQAERARYEELAHDETILSKELNLMEKRFEAWEGQATYVHPVQVHGTGVARPTVAAVTRPPVAVVRQTPHPAGAPAEVVAVYEQLDEMGKTGGWDERDHAHYMRLRVQFNHKISRAFMERAALEIPGKELADIEMHNEWFSRVQELEAEKKEAIKKWRSRKDSDKTAQIEEKETRPSPSTDPEFKINFEREREEKKRKLAEWKAAKELEKKQRDVQEQRIRDEKARKKREDEERMKEYVEKMLKAEKEKRLKEKEKGANKKGTEGSKPANPLTKEERAEQQRKLLELQERDKRLLQKKQDQLGHQEMKKREEKERLDKLAAQVKPKVARNFDRLTKPTKAFENRALEEPEFRGHWREPGSTAFPSRRATPSWRK